MARLKGVSDSDAGLVTKAVYGAARRRLVGSGIARQACLSNSQEQCRGRCGSWFLSLGGLSAFGFRLVVGDGKIAL